MAAGFVDRGDLQRDNNSPIPPRTRCTALKDFVGEMAHDLPFRQGELLTIIEPCNVVFWYLAENSVGRRGVIPINFVEVHYPASPSSQPSPPSPPSPKQRPSQPSQHSPKLRPSHPSPPSPKSLPSHPSPPSQHSPKPFPSPPSQHSPKPLPSPRRLPPTPPKDKPPSSATLPRASAPLHKQLGRSSSSDDRKGTKDEIDSRPPAPLPVQATQRKEPEPLPYRGPGRYRTNKEFLEKSGWFTPGLESVLCKKAKMQLSAFRTSSSGIYLFLHKHEPEKRYVGDFKGPEGLIHLFHRLYEKPEWKLNPIEDELKYNSPNADDWYITVTLVNDHDELDFLMAKKIVMFRTLQPCGLNPELKFISKEHFYRFAEWYAEQRREIASKGTAV